MVRDRHVGPGHFEFLREVVRRHPLRLVPHQFFAGEEKDLGILFLRFLQPRFKGSLIGHIRRDMFVVIGVDQFIVDQHVRPAAFVFNVADFFHEILVVAEECRAAFKFPFNQCLTNEEFAGQFRIVLRVGNAPLLIHGKSVERASFKRRHRTALLFPMRFRPAFL